MLLIPTLFHCWYRYRRPGPCKAVAVWSVLQLRSLPPCCVITATRWDTKNEIVLNEVVVLRATLAMAAVVTGRDRRSAAHDVSSATSWVIYAITAKSPKSALLVAVTASRAPQQQRFQVRTTQVRAWHWYSCSLIWCVRRRKPSPSVTPQVIVVRMNGPGLPVCQILAVPST